MTFVCEITDQTGQPTLAIRTRSSVEDLPVVLGNAFGAIIDHITALGEKPAGAPYAAYFNMDMQDLDVEVGFPVEKPLTGTDIIQSGYLPQGKAATCLYTGPYAEMGVAYEALKNLIEESGYLPTGEAYEFYYDSPDTSPDKTRTLIMLPLKAVND
jgi:effector-binding domain-containing protein